MLKYVKTEIMGVKDMVEDGTPNDQGLDSARAPSCNAECLAALEGILGSISH